MAKKKKKENKLSFTGIQIMVFAVFGAAVGMLFSFAMYDNLFRQYVKSMYTYVENDWGHLQYYAGKGTDQVIRLRDMLEKDKVRHRQPAFDAAIDARARLIGSAGYIDKTRAMLELEEALSGVMEWYNSRMDLRNKRFSYIEWGMITAEYLDNYNRHKENYVNAVKDYNFRIERFPFRGIAKKLNLEKIPAPETFVESEVDLKREKYTKDNVFRMDLMEGTSSAGSY